MGNPTSTPVLFLIFNRPDLTRRVFQRIREAQPQRLFVAADGPRSDRPGEENLCLQARRETNHIDWDCQVERLDRDTNLGCKRAVSSAVSWFFEQVHAGIILEDDCLPDHSFFPYCTELLERYRNEPGVALIGGFNFRNRQNEPSGKSSYYFTKYPQIWGWATWRRTWDHYDAEMTAWNGDSKGLNGISNPRMRRRFAKKFASVKAGRNDTWDYQLIHQCLASRSLGIDPSVNLVENIGFDARATHTTRYGSAGPPPPAGSLSFPLIHPSTLHVDQTEERDKETRFYQVPPDLWVSLIWSIKKRCCRLYNRLKK